MELGKLGIWTFLDAMPATDAAAAAKRFEELGFSALWIPETAGRHPFAAASWLLANTTTLNVATGIASIYHREPGVTLAGQKTLAEQSGDRFLLGLGVSHQQFVEGVRKLEYKKPVTTMRNYLAAMDQSPFMGLPPATEPKRVIAALGPKMLELARDACDGAHPYFSNPTHTEMARKILGPDAMLCVEQKVILEEDEAVAHKAARAVSGIYIGLPNYRNNWLRMGLNQRDLENGGSDRFVEETFAWGSAGKIRERIDAHFAAGASHVCIQPINPTGNMTEIHWKALEALSPAA